MKRSVIKYKKGDDHILVVDFENVATIETIRRECSEEAAVGYLHGFPHYVYIPSKDKILIADAGASPHHMEKGTKYPKQTFEYLMQQMKLSGARLGKIKEYHKIREAVI